MLKFITVSALLLCAAVSFAQFENPSVDAAQQIMQDALVAAGYQHALVAEIG
jgi:hypothetical protein